MNKLFNKYENLNQLIKKYHNDSLYASKPLPKLIAVSKQQPDEKILNALENGQRIFGENKLQEALKRWSHIINTYKNIELHYIGHLQSNKVKEQTDDKNMFGTLVNALNGLKDGGRTLEMIFNRRERLLTKLTENINDEENLGLLFTLFE